MTAWSKQISRPWLWGMALACLGAGMLVRHAQELGGSTFWPWQTSQAVVDLTLSGPVRVSLWLTPAPRRRTQAGAGARLGTRLAQRLPPQLLADFSLFIYVDEGVQSGRAQRMYVFAKGPQGRLRRRYSWLVSTGRGIAQVDARGARLNTATPTGYFELDPHRFYPHYVSHEWDEPMPYAMFFDWMRKGELSGLAIHATSGPVELSELGQRASAGCVRLAPRHARLLFNLIRRRYAGEEVRFATDEHGNMSRRGRISRGPHGHTKWFRGYRVLVILRRFRQPRLARHLGFAHAA